MRHATRLTRALSLLLAVMALLPAALLARAPSCGDQGPSLVHSCCCKAAAPAGQASTSLKSVKCGCSSEQAPAAPDRSVAPSPELAGLAALPPAPQPPTSATTATDARRLAPQGHRAAGSELLRLHCVILI